MLRELYKWSPCDHVTASYVPGYCQLVLTDNKLVLLTSEFVSFMSFVQFSRFACLVLNLNHFFILKRQIFFCRFSSNGSKDHVSYSHHSAFIVILSFMFVSLLWNYCQMEIHPQMDPIKIFGAETTRSNDTIWLVDPQTSFVKKNFCGLKFHVAGKVLGWYSALQIVWFLCWSEIQDGCHFAETFMDCSLDDPP